MSSVESASMSSSEVSEKGPVDFGVKAVSFKSQTDGSRLVPLRTIAPPSVSRPPSFSSQHSSNQALQQKPGLSRGTPGGGPIPNPPGGPPTLGNKTSTPSTAPLIGPATYFLPRGSTVAGNVGVRGPGPSRTSVQAVTTVQSLVRTPSPVGTQPGASSWSAAVPLNNLRASSPSSGLPRCVVPARTVATVAANKPGAQSRPVPEGPRPLLLHSTSARPLTLTPTQLQITSDKTMKLPIVSVSQVLPIRTPFCPTTAFVNPSQAATILQRSDGNVGGTALLTTPVRLTTTQPPLLTTQRVAVSASTTRITVQPQQLTVTSHQPQSRVQASALSGSRSSGPPPTILPGGPKGGPPLPAGTILPASGRITYGAQVFSGPATVARMPTPGTTTVLSTTKTLVAGPAPMPVTSGMRMPNHSSGKPQRFGTVRPQLPTTSVQAASLVVHPQLVVSSGKPNHIASTRPPLTSAPVQKVISQSVVTSKPPTLTTLPATSTQLTPVISKQPPEVYKSASVTMVAAQPVMGKVFQPSSSAEVDIHQTSSVYIPASHRTIPSPGAPGLICSQATLMERQYTFPGGTSYIYEAPSGYQLAPDAPLVARPLSPDAPLVSRQLSSDGPLIARPFTPGLITSQAMRFNPVMIMDPNVSVQQSFTPTSNCETTEQTMAPAKITSSPRPSILRKREIDSSSPASKVAKNLSTALSSGGPGSRSRTPSPPTPPTSLHLETNQTSNDHGPSSNGSTTISATSSPGPEDNPDPDRPPVEMSPRKKPRKQLLNDASEPLDMEFISEERMKKEKESSTCLDKSNDEGTKVYVVKRPANMGLLHGYKCGWKTRLSHFQRYSDVKPRDDKRHSVTEIANQRNIVQRVNGWKVYQLTTQFEDLSETEDCVLERLSTIFKAMDNNLGKDLEKDVSRVNDLIMGNIQRSKVIRDQMEEAKTQVMKVFDHKVHVSEIISRCASKRNFKKRDKY